MQSPKAGLWAVGMLVLAVLAAYSNSFSGEFIFDDGLAIEKNPTIRQLWPLGHCEPPCKLAPELNAFVYGRPLLNFSFAINYALGGMNVWGYHVLNVAIHIANALLLFGVLRRTFELAALREKFGSAALALSFAIALLWAVHPLQTESVTYIVQRAESLVALFYLLTLYCVVRGADSPKPAGWYAGAVTACLLGMSAKEVMVTAPAVVLLYDRCFLAGSFRQALSRRRWVYAGMALSWVFLASLVVFTGDLSNLYAGRGGPRADLNPWSYAATQPGAILHYLRLTLWPHPLVLDYHWPAAKGVEEVLPAAVVIGLLAAATLWGVLARKPWGFLGAWFFVILSPTSSVVPLQDPVFEHRMYLPLAGVLTLLVLAAYAGTRAAANRVWIPQAAGPMLGMGVLAATATILGTMTFQRNKDYATELSIWRDTVIHAPDNPRVRLNLGHALARHGQAAEAIGHYRKALALKPDYYQASYNLALALAAVGQADEAISRYREELRLKPDSAEAHYNIGAVLAGTGKVDEAIRHYQEAVRLKPDFAEANYNLGLVLAGMGQTEEAIRLYREALRLKPDYVEAHLNFGSALVASGKADLAIVHFREALKLRPGYVKALLNLGNAEAILGKEEQAITHFREVLKLNPGDAEAHNNLGVVFAGRGELEKAFEEFSLALRINPAYADAKANLERLTALAKQRRN